MVHFCRKNNKVLSDEITNGKFRMDLFHRLNVINIHIPPLRERKEDIKPLLYHFLKCFNIVHNKKISGLGERAISILLRYKWEGNIREFRNFIEKLVIYSKTDFLEVNDVLILFEEKASDIRDKSLLMLKEAKSKFEKDFITNALILNDGKILETAKSLGLDRSHLFKKMKALEIKKFDVGTIQD